MIKKEDEKPLVCEHEYEKNVISEGDCKTKELDLYTCKKCKYSYKEYGDYGEHNFKEEYWRNDLNLTKNEFIKTSHCTICNEVFEEKVKYKDHHYILESDTGTKAIYKCIICNEKIEYTFNIKDFNYSINQDNSLIITGYNGTSKNVYIPSNLVINYKKILVIIIYVFLIIHP